jgi:hypothetical protein
MKIKIISTFSDAGYYDYAKHFVESCIKNIKNISVVIYKDNVDLQDTAHVKFLNLESTCPDLVEFKKRNSNKTFKDFRFDGVRFSHKVYATIHAAQETDLDYLIWLDADTEIYDTVDPTYFLKFLPKGKFVGYVGRDTASETGFLIFDMRHPEANNFFDRYEWYYNSDEIYNLPEFHDGFIFDVIRKEFESSGRFVSHNVSPVGATKNHFNAAFDGYMLHFKGGRKEKREEQISKALRRKRKA